MDRREATLKDFVLYFLRLGTTGFGGPVVLTGHMNRDLVEERGWLSQEDYNQGLALSQLMPGPLAAQLAIYIGWVKAGTFGATLVGGAFILPSFLIVLGLSALYVRYGGLPWLPGLFYGIGAAVIAVMAQSTYKLSKRTLGKNRLFWLLGVASAVVTIATESEFFVAFVIAGILAVTVKAPPKFGRFPTALSIIPPWLLQGLNGTASSEGLWKLGVFFAKSGAMVFGSGLAIVPFLHGGVVQQFHWLSERQFLDAVAVAMVTPGPVVITVAFIGFLVAGFAGACVAALGVFFPCYLLVVFPAPYFQRFAKNAQVHAFVCGVTAAAIGAIAGASVVLGKRAIIDVPTALLALGSLLILAKAKRIPEPVVILLAGIAGLLLRS